MKQLFCLLALSLIALTAFAQSDKSLCNRMFQEAQAAENSPKPDYRAAIQKYNAAKKCNPARESEINRCILAVFEKIEDLRDVAERNRILADKAAAEARKLAEKARQSEIESENAARAGRNAVTALKVARTNPTVGLRMAEYVMNTNKKNSVPAVVFGDIYGNQDNRYYFRSITGKHEQLSAVTYSPDGTKLLTGSYRVAELWDLTKPDDQEPVVFSGHWNTVPSVAISPDGQLVLTSSRDTVKLWSIKGDPIRWFVGHSAHISSLNFSPDGSSILTTSFDSTAKLWTLNGQELRTFKGHQGNVWAAAFSPDGKTILTGGADNIAKLWSLDGAEIVTYKGHLGAVRAVAFSPDGQRVLTGSSDNTAIIWSLNGGRINILRGHKGAVNAVEFSPKGNTLLTGSFNETTKLWTADGWEITTLTGHNLPATAAKFSPDGKHIATVSNDQTIKIWNTGTERATITDSEQVEGDFSTMAFGPKGVELLIRRYSTVIVRDINGYEKNSFDVAYGGDDSAVSALTFSPDKTKILTAVADTIKLWTKEGTLLQSIPASGIIKDLVYAPDGNSFLVLKDNGKVALWGVNGQRIAQFDIVDTVKVLCMAFSPNGKNIVFGYDDAKARVWDAGGKQLGTLTGHTDDVTAVAFSIDNKTIMTGSLDNTAILWNVDGKPLTTLKGHKGGVFKVMASPDTLLTLTLGYDNSLKLWNSEGWEIASFPFYYYVKNVNFGFTRDSRWLIVADEFQGMYSWPTPKHVESAYAMPISLMEMLQNGLILTDEEVLNSKEPELLVYWGDQKFKQENWDIALNYYEKAEAIYHTTRAVIGLFEVSQKKGWHFDFNRFAQSNTPEELLRYANYMYNLKKWEEAYRLYSKADSIQPSERSLLGRLQTSMILKKPLNYQPFLSSNDPEKLFFYARGIRPTIGITESKPNNLREIYSITAQLENKAIELDTALASETKSRLSQTYNDLGYRQLFIKDPIGAIASEISILRGIELDSTNRYLLTNLPIAYLLQGRYLEAEKIYWGKRNDPCLPPRFATYKDAFLQDFKDLEAAGITHPDFAKIRTMLLQEKQPIPPVDDNDPPKGQ